MKKFISIIAVLFMMIMPTFARQFCEVYDTKYFSSEEISKLINKYLNNGFKLVSMVALSNRSDRFIDNGLTTSVIVVFDDCGE
jgi:hypothetical protein